MNRTEPIVVKYCTFRTMYMYKYIARSVVVGEKLPFYHRNALFLGAVT